MSRCIANSDEHTFVQSQSNRKTSRCKYCGYEVETTDELILAQEIWSKLELAGCKYSDKCPTIEFKQGGYSAAYYPKTHQVKLRTNVWNKLDLGQKRLLMIHELIHATGINHSCEDGYLGAMDNLSREVYIAIYGNDEHMQKMISKWQHLAHSIIRAS